MRFALLGSGSRGNSTLVQVGRTTLLIDNGFSLRDTERRLARLQLSPADIDAILVTHEHGDHIDGIGALARKYALPVWLTAGTRNAGCVALGQLPKTEIFTCHCGFNIGDVCVTPFTVPHDAREPAQFVFSDGVFRLGVLTDVGRVTPHIRGVLEQCQALILEFNHDEELLAGSGYPPSLKHRIAGPFGHLSNRQAAELIQKLQIGSLRKLVAAHLSESNNSAERVRDTLDRYTACGGDSLLIADQERGLGWQTLD